VAEVIIQESESLENALRRFKRKVQQEDIIKEIKKHSFYMKPGEKRRAKEALSRKRLRKKQRANRINLRGGSLSRAARSLSRLGALRSVIQAPGQVVNGCSEEAESRS
jgi:small subunit ribosomal protein S21